jgi:hypothetical protein
VPPHGGSGGEHESGDSLRGDSCCLHHFAKRASNRM